MPEMLFDIRWPDGTEQRCYSPSLVIGEHLEPGARYPLDDFLARVRTALAEASERVRRRYGMPCGRAIGQLDDIERHASRLPRPVDGPVTVLAFHGMPGPGTAT